MANDKEVIIAMRAGQTELKKDLDDIKRTIDNKFKSYKAPTGGWFSGMKASLSGIIAAVGGATAAFGFLKTSIQEAVNARKEFALVETAVRNTGGAAGFTAQEIKKLADELERTTGIDGGDIMKGVYAQLLAFSDIKGDNFKRTAQAVLDMATAMDKTADMKGQTQMLAKALVAPEKGLKALTAAGIVFNDEQRKMIIEMSKSGQTAQAQNIILDEITSKYSDQAKAIYEATGGLMSFDITVKQVEESIGEAALPTLSVLNKKLVETLQSANESGTGINTLSSSFQFLGIAIVGISGWLQGIINTLALFVGAALAAANTITSGFSKQSMVAFSNTVTTGLKNIDSSARDTIKTIQELWDAYGRKGSSESPKGSAPDISGNAGGSGAVGGEKQKFDELKWYSNEYYNERVKLINKEYEELKKSKDKSIDLELWYDDQIKALDDDLQKEILRRYGENAETIKQKRLKEEQEFNTLMLSAEEQAQADLGAMLEESLDKKSEAYNNYFSNLKPHQDEWVSYQVAKLEEELEGYKQIGIAKEEIELMRQERLNEIEEEAFEARWELWKKQNEGFVAMGEVLQAGFESTFDAMFDSQLSGAEKVKKVFESIKSTALNVLKDILMGFILNSIKSAVVGQVQQAAAVAGAVATGSAIAAAYAPAAAMASLASFGANAIAAQSGIASTIGMSQALATTGIGFAKGGDFIVPPGYSNDSYPIRVQSFERVQVTPANKVGQDLAMLADIASSIKALNMNLVKKDMSVRINTNIDAVKFTKDVTYKSSNKLSKSGVKQSDY